MKLFKWFYPGLNVKRWLFVALLGILFLSWGLSLILESQSLRLITVLEFFVEYDYLSATTIFLIGLALVIIGILFLIYGFRKILFSVINTIFPVGEEELIETIYKKRQLKRGPKIVALGGGTGLSVLLRGLKNYTSNITAIVTVTDDGGSSGRLRGDLKILPPGDIRNCILALASQESLMEKVLDYRFDEGVELEGHNLGNLLLGSLTQITGNFYNSIQEVSRILAIQGQVLPATLQSVTLGAKMSDGNIVLGETEIVNYDKGKIEEVFLKPENCRPIENTLKAIREADAIVLGPGSLYTSIIPNILVPEIKEEITKARCPVFYVCNIMTQSGETDGFDAEDHYKAIKSHVNKPLIDYIVLNTAKIPEIHLNRYKEKHAEPVLYDHDKLQELDLKILKAPMLEKNEYLRHDSDKLGRVILRELFRQKPYSERLKMFDLILNKRLKILLGWSDD